MRLRNTLKHFLTRRMPLFDITVTVVFHHENRYVIPALASMHDLVNKARTLGIRVEARALLDNANALTTELVNARGQSWLDGIEHVSFGDFGMTRNAGVQSASGKFLAFFDGDDLWGSDWLLHAYQAAVKENDPTQIIWHPELIYYFYESDFHYFSPSKK